MDNVACPICKGCQKSGLINTDHGDLQPMFNRSNVGIIHLQIQNTKAFVALSVTLLLLFLTLTFASGNVLFHMDGLSNKYTDSFGTSTLIGIAQFSARGRAFGPRMAPIQLPYDTKAGGFPHALWGVDGIDNNGNGMFTDLVDQDPVNIMDDIITEGEGVYNIVAGAGWISAPEIIRRLEAARDRSLKWIMQYNTALSADKHSVDVAGTRARLQNYVNAFNQRPDLKQYLYAFQASDEPVFWGMSLSEQQKLYQTYKNVFPDIPVFITSAQGCDLSGVFGASADTNNDGICDGMLGQPSNPFGIGVADIITIDVFPIGRTHYYYDAIYNNSPANIYTHARKFIDSLNSQITEPNQKIKLWVQPQARSGDWYKNQPLETHQLYRQINDFFRIAADNDLQPPEGIIYYTWKESNDTASKPYDLEMTFPIRKVARSLGQQFMTGNVNTHRMWYPNELYIPPAPAANMIKAPAENHFKWSSGTITLSVSANWSGNDNRRHVIFDMGESTTRNRLYIEKTSDNVLRLVIVDVNGNEKWTGMNVDLTNFGAGDRNPAYADLMAVWDNGILSLYLDSIKAMLSGGIGTGQITGGGTYVYLGSDMNGQSGLDGTLNYLIISDAAYTDAEAHSWAINTHINNAPFRPLLVSPPDGSQVSTTKPRFTWNSVSFAAMYQIQVSSDANFSTFIEDKIITATSYTTTLALSIGNTYYWRVRAYDNYGYGNWSNGNTFVYR